MFETLDLKLGTEARKTTGTVRTKIWLTKVTGLINRLKSEETRQTTGYKYMSASEELTWGDP